MLRAVLEENIFKMTEKELFERISKIHDELMFLLEQKCSILKTLYQAYYELAYFHSLRLARIHYALKILKTYYELKGELDG